MIYFRGFDDFVTNRTFISLYPFGILLVFNLLISVHSCRAKI